MSKRNLKKTTKIGIIVFIVLAVIGIILGVVFGVIIPNQKTSEEKYWNRISEKREIENLDLEIPDYITNIPNNAFRDFTNLTSVTIPTSVTSIGDDPFPKNPDTIVNRHFKVPAGTTTITGDLWARWGVDKITLKEVIIPLSVTIIGDSAFEGCTSLASIAIPTSVTSIGNSAFPQNTIVNRHFRVPAGTTTITNNLWAMWDVEKITLKEVIIPFSVTSIGNYAFDECSSLESVTIPDSVTSIGYWAFYRCTSLASLAIPSSVTSIGHNAFYNCSALESLVIPSSVTSIGSFAFKFCSNLTSLTIEDIDKIKSIGDQAFARCNLTEVTINKTIYTSCLKIKNKYSKININAFKDNKLGNCE